MSKLIAFYQNKVVHPYGYTIEEIWGWDYQKLESSHNVVVYS